MTTDISNKQVKAFLLLNTKGRDDEAMNYVGKLQHVTDAKKLYGVYDISAEVTAPNMDGLKNTINNVKRQGYEVLTLLATEKAI